MTKRRFIFGIVFILASAFLLLAIGKRNSSPVLAQEPKVSNATSSIKKFNRLGKEKSPYLLQHKDNPVFWFPWGEEAFQAAKRENKIIFLSIGYSTCYWCHVMEKDSFERDDVAAVLNKDFISIKVDREEHPDVDQIYMDAVVGMTGSGGWPMSVLLTPELKPFFGGTFFRREQFLQILSRAQDAWHHEPDKIRESGAAIAVALEKQNHISGSAPVNVELLRQTFHQLQKRFDPIYGGFGKAPKFPHAMELALLLRIHRRTGNAEALDIVTRTLDAMSHGGIYDQLGGGFHRYATDARWFAPHFEKMLYDNAMLGSTYLEAYQATHREEYATVAREILNYVLRDMTDPSGGFYSAEDAGEVGKEGEFYTWTEKELRYHLTPHEFEVFRKVYSITSAGNFENGKNILYRSLEKNPVKNAAHLLKSARDKLLAIRNLRQRPHKDDKVLTAWNGLMIATLSKGYQVLGDRRYLDAATNAAEFIRTKLYQEGKLLRRYRDGESLLSGTVNDYAFLIHGLLTLHESNFDPQWVRWAQALQKKQDDLFWDEKDGGYFFTAAEEKALLIRKKEFDDGVTPSGNSLAALNLSRLHDLTFDEKYADRLNRLFGVIAAVSKRYPAGYAQAMMAMDYELDRSKEVAVVGKPNDQRMIAIKTKLFQMFLPNKVLAMGNPGAFDDPKTLPILQGKTIQQESPTIYVCEDKICKMPTTDWDKAEVLMNDFEKYEL